MTTSSFLIKMKSEGEYRKGLQMERKLIFIEEMQKRITEQ
jgi:hypothetical protein